MWLQSNNTISYYPQ